eukprot:PhF_6_TR28070/c0_g1_i3/m.41460
MSRLSTSIEFVRNGAPPIRCTIVPNNAIIDDDAKNTSNILATKITPPSSTPTCGSTRRRPLGELPVVSANTNTTLDPAMAVLLSRQATRRAVLLREEDEARKELLDQQSLVDEYYKTANHIFAQFCHKIVGHFKKWWAARPRVAAKDKRPRSSLTDQPTIIIEHEPVPIPLRTRPSTRYHNLLQAAPYLMTMTSEEWLMLESWISSRNFRTQRIDEEGISPKVTCVTIKKGRCQQQTTATAVTNTTSQPFQTNVVVAPLASYDWRAKDLQDKITTFQSRLKKMVA